MTIDKDTARMLERDEVYRIRGELAVIQQHLDDAHAVFHAWSQRVVELTKRVAMLRRKLERTDIA